MFLTHSYNKGLGGWVVYVNGKLLRKGSEGTRSSGVTKKGTPVVFTNFSKSATRQQIHDYLLERLENGEFEQYRYPEFGNYSIW